MQFWSLSQEDPLEEERATHSSILAWKIPWTEQPGRLQSMGSQNHQIQLSNLAHRYYCPHFRDVETEAYSPTAGHDRGKVQAQVCLIPECPLPWHAVIRYTTQGRPPLQGGEQGRLPGQLCVSWALKNKWDFELQSWGWRMGCSREMYLSFPRKKSWKLKKKNHSVCLVTGEEAVIENLNNRAVGVGLNWWENQSIWILNAKW